jgi:hypothetical protein
VRPEFGTVFFLGFGIFLSSIEARAGTQQ